MPAKSSAPPAEPGSPAPIESGRLIAEILAGAWRTRPPSPRLTAEAVAAAARPLIESGAAPLAWHGIATDAALAADDRLAPLQRDARRCAIRDSIHELLLPKVVGILNQAGVLPMLFKGWAVARLYADSYLRPYGDFDLLVRPQDHKAAQAALARASYGSRGSVNGRDYAILCERLGKMCAVDLHRDLLPQYGCDTAALFSHSAHHTLPEGGSLLLPCAEDHLRIVTLHFFRHGGWRPLWLCDIAAMVESAAPDFDWERCAAGDPVTRGWIGAGIAAAHELLDCRIDHVPVSVRSPLPAWLRDTILAQWEAPYAGRFLAVRMAPTLSYVRSKLRERWPNPIAAVFMRGNAASHPGRLRDQLLGFGANIAMSMTNLARADFWRSLPAR
jgi:putative nucleotidyltransferase-like protein